MATVTEKHWKEQAFWFAVIGTAIASFIVWFSAGYRIGLQTPPNEPITYRIIVEHAQAPILTSADLQQQAIYPVRQGKRSEPGKLSPETERALHAQAIWEIFKNGRDPFEVLK